MSGFAVLLRCALSKAENRVFCFKNIGKAFCSLNKADHGFLLFDSVIFPKLGFFFQKPHIKAKVVMTAALLRGGIQI